MPLTSLELFQQYQLTPSIKVRNKIVELNMKLVRKLANQACAKCSENYADLEQVGAIGLIRAVELFDIKKGFAFSSFAVPYIRGEIQHYLRDRGGKLVKIPRSWQEISSKSYNTRQKALKEGIQLSDEEIAIRLGIKLSILKKAEEATKAHLVWLDEFEQKDLGEIPLESPQLSEKTHNLERYLWGEEFSSFQSALQDLDPATRQAIEIALLQRRSLKSACQSLGIGSAELSQRLKSGCERLSVAVA